MKTKKPEIFRFLLKKIADFKNFSDFQSILLIFNIAALFVFFSKNILFYIRVDFFLRIKNLYAIYISEFSHIYSSQLRPLLRF